MMTRTLATACAILASSFLVAGCNSESTGTPNKGDDSTVETGAIGLPLSAVSTTGVEYRLRNGEFNLWGWPNDCWEEDCEYYDQTISSEDYLDQPSITLDLMRGEYDVYLNPGWQLEKVVDGVGEVVEAQLISSEYQYAWVQPYQTTWITFQFGVGSEELWFTGQLQLNMEVYEDPEDYYGGDCYYYGDGEVCWQECCTDYCDSYGCWSECWAEEVPCDEIPADDEPVQPPISGTGGAPSF